MNPITVSIVEDLNEVREALERLINQSENFGFVAGYINAELAEKDIPLQPPDIVIMDINLPGMSGIECINRIKEKLLEALEELHNGGSPMTTNIARKVIEAFEKKDQPPEELNTLTNKEKQILDLLAKGFLYKEIAIQLHSTRNTVKQHIHHIYEKLHVQNRTEALNKAFPRR